MEKLNLRTELEALKQNLLADPTIEFVTAAQVGGLNGLIRMGCEDKSRDMRVAILKAWAGDAMMAIAGVEIESSKNLTLPVATFLINLLLEPDSTPWRLSEYGLNLIRATEILVNITKEI